MKQNKTATEIQAEINYSERNKLMIDTLKKIQKLLTQLNDCITILISPVYVYKGDKK
jgi:cystathionine beta-lyase family protein involved in aluminum resistance